jgi:hypothetical protein
MNNFIQGFGPTSIIASNGIQASRGSTVEISGNTVSDNVFTPMTVVSTGILIFEEVAIAPVAVEFNFPLINNDVGLYMANSQGVLIQGNDSSNNTQYGIINDTMSIANVYIQNSAFNNPVFDIADFSVGIVSAMTGNLYLCNMCDTDNKGGQLCDSMGVVSGIPISTAEMLETFLPPVMPVYPLPSPE